MLLFPTRDLPVLHHSPAEQCRFVPFAGLYDPRGRFAEPSESTGYNGGVYDAAEPNTPWDTFQDYGHSHWQNSLFVGVDIANFPFLAQASSTTVSPAEVLRAKLPKGIPTSLPNKLASETKR